MTLLEPILFVLQEHYTDLHYTYIFSEFLQHAHFQFVYSFGRTLSLIQATRLSAFIKANVSVLFHISPIDYMNSKSVN